MVAIHIIPVAHARAHRDETTCTALAATFEAMMPTHDKVMITAVHTAAAISPSAKNHKFNGLQNRAPIATDPEMAPEMAITIAVAEEVGGSPEDRRQQTTGRF